MKIKLATICIAILIYIGTLPGQDSLNHELLFPVGITIEYGTGNYSVTDEYISKEKYSGTLPHFLVRWSKKHDDYVYQLDMSYRNSNEISSNNVTTEITQFTFNQGFLYSLGKTTLFRKSLYLWLGPATDFFFYNNDQNIAVSGFEYVESFAALLSLGCDFQAIYPLNTSFHLESVLGFPVLAVGIRMIDEEEDDQSAFKLLTPFTGLNASFDLGVRYYIFNRLSAKLAYKLELTRISAWDPLLSASDNVIIGLTYGF